MTACACFILLWMGVFTLTAHSEQKLIYYQAFLTAVAIG